LIIPRLEDKPAAVEYALPSPEIDLSPFRLYGIDPIEKRDMARSLRTSGSVKEYDAVCLESKSFLDDPHGTHRIVTVRIPLVLQSVRLNLHRGFLIRIGIKGWSLLSQARPGRDTEKQDHQQDHIRWVRCGSLSSPHLTL
jgi:hypothetical protein